MTNPERLPRWFLPVEGDLEPGGRYQLQRNAGGIINTCQPPQRLDLTWEFGGAVSWVELRLAADGAERTCLTLSHIAPVNEHWQTYGPGATGIGWELGLLGLAQHLAEPMNKFDEAAFSALPAARCWAAPKPGGRPTSRAGEEAEHARSAAARTSAFYTQSAPPQD